MRNGDSGLPLYLTFLSSLKKYVDSKPGDGELKKTIKKDIEKLAAKLVMLEDGKYE